MRISFRNRYLVGAVQALPSCVVRRFLREQDGAAAVEFAIIMVPFFALMFAIMETALVFFASQTLETAVADSGRLIMTGQAQEAKMDKAAFKNAVCDRIYALFDCQNGLYVDVRKYDTFANTIFTKPTVDEEGNFNSDFVYEPAGPGCITVVRLFYQWPVYLHVGGFDLSDIAKGKRLLSATAAFRNEPYDNGGTC